MSNVILNRIHECLRNDHLCCLIGEPAEGHTYAIAGIHREFDNTGFVVIRLDIDTEVNPTTSRAASTQGWYETFFNLILGQLQRSSLSLSLQQRREIRNLSCEQQENSFEKFYKVLSDIAQENQRPFLLHLTQINCLGDPISNLSENNIQLFFEAIDSYCLKSINAVGFTSTADFPEPDLYFLLEGNGFPETEGLRSQQVLGKSIINISPTITETSPSLDPTENLTNEFDQSQVCEDISSLLAITESVDSRQGPHELTTLIEQETVNENDHTTIDSSTDSEADTSNMSIEWLTRLRFVALGFIAATFLIPLVLSQTRSPRSVVAISSKQTIPTSIPTPTPEPELISQAPTPTFIPTTSSKSFDEDLILQTIRERTVYFYGSTGNNYSGQVFFSEIRNRNNRPEESGVAARIEWNDGVISSILFTDNFRVRVWEEEKEYSGKWYWESDQSNLIIEMDDGGKYKF